MLDTFVQQLGKELNMEEQITVVERGHYKLPFEGDFDVDAFQSPEGLYTFKGLIGPYPNQKVEEFLTRVMEANLFGKGTYGAVIGLSEDEKLLTLSLQVDYNSNYKEWVGKLQDFVSVMDFWREAAQNYR